MNPEGELARWSERDLRRQRRRQLSTGLNPAQRWITDPVHRWVSPVERFHRRADPIPAAPHDLLPDAAFETAVRRYQQAQLTGDVGTMLDVPPEVVEVALALADGQWHHLRFSAGVLSARLVRFWSGARLLHTRVMTPGFESGGGARLPGQWQQPAALGLLDAAARALTDGDETDNA